ncbi:FAD-dependent monooxygenase [Devosia sp. XJ19-1]|uniref:FAD-dependent monooxygenase n=1 Tax=Devosia ureilytica TaxID=2952754 RepID=A0A9Q4FUA4_9HYPH|nr:FAD-dependent monooxygenase [Devosia ureilytica]MCP8884783.1 FAD-dependent monooxygenase [Devosia ureilytica]MCP8888414.1 FAD-dependent monooxygenase [Devosia ureilytica]
MRAIISGAGIAGLSAALALDRAGWAVTVLERAPGLRAGGYMLDFYGPGFDAAADLGVIDALAARARRVGKIDFVNESGRAGSSMDYEQIRRATGDKLFPILRGDIERVLHSALPDRVGLRYSCEIASLNNRSDGVTVTLDSGETLEADLLVGAEGIHSAMRQMVFGDESQFIRPLGHHTAAYFFDSPVVATALAGDFKMIAIKQRLMGLFEVEPNRIMAFFVLRADGLDRPRDPGPILAARFGDLGWVVPEVLAAMPDPQEIYYDVVAQIVMPRWHQDRVVLIGDAAHAVSLVAGQGASLAIAGGRALGQVLTGTDDVDLALEHFEAQLRPLVTDKQAAGRRMADWFVPASARHAWLRDVTVKVMNWPPFAGVIGRYFAVSSKGFSLK